MIDQAVHSRGVGGSEIAAILGMDPRRDAFSVWASKTGRVPPMEANTRMKWGKALERVIAEAYASETHQIVSWCDQTMSHPSRPWQIATPDAFVLGDDGSLTPYRIGGADCKNVALDQAWQWGEPGSDSVPQPIALQLQWYCSTFDLPWWDACALMGGNDLRIFRINRDAEIEAILLTEVERFWRDNVLADVAPEPGPSQATVDALKAMYPKNTAELRVATEAEIELLAKLKEAVAKEKESERHADAIKNVVKLAIGEGDGLTFPGDRGKTEKVTWKKDADSWGTNWEAIAREIYANTVDFIDRLKERGIEILEHRKTLDEIAREFQIVTRVGPRKLLVPRHWTKE